MNSTECRRVSLPNVNIILIFWLILGICTAIPHLASAQSTGFPGCYSFVRYVPDEDVTVEFHSPSGYVIGSAIVSYTASVNHCTSVRADIFVNDIFVGNTGWVPPGGTSVIYDVTDIIAHSDSAVVSLLTDIDCRIGDGCCSSGFRGSWAGQLCLQGEALTVAPTTWSKIKALYK